ncbi:hypothetical protein EC973_000735 [Apophysomyces ossiformis]|uniref:Xaa-Pro aminopeptidase n=1 Tax=Apophysomyces ossiformis TaxID=679940 RepID=A0A8H7BQB0_9FUNG|nr:hypothetical protein EC973_000735 [Apophysomyces ossiformis]
MTTRKTKGILKTIHKKPQSVTSDSSSSSWLSRIQSKLYATDDLSVSTLPRQELRRVTFRVKQLTTEHILYSPDDTTATEENFQPKAQLSQDELVDCSQELPKYYERACRMREEPALDPFMDILRSGDQGQSFSPLTTIDLSNQIIDRRQVGAMADILTIHTKLELLNLSSCGLDDDVGICLVYYNSIRPILNSLLIGESLPELNLSHNPFKTKGFKYLAIFISESRAIKSIDLSRCLPDKKALQFLSQGILVAPSLQHLNLDHCSLKSSMIESLAEGVRQSVSLTSLSLRNNWISHNAAPWIAAMLLNEVSIETYWQPPEYQRRGIRQLDLTGNNLQHAAVPLAQALYSNSSLVQLVLDNCQIRSEGCAILAEALIQALKTALAQNRTLLDLGLAETGLDSSAAIALAESLPENCSLTRLDLSRNPSITMAGVMALAISIKMNDTITFLDINIPQKIMHALSARYVLRNARYFASAAQGPSASRLMKLRTAMAECSEKLDAFGRSSGTSPARHVRPISRLTYKPLKNAQSEYTAECDNRRAWISGFTGSAGCAVVTQKTAALFTDGRYFLQASQELDPRAWTLMKEGLPGVPTWPEYLVKHLPPKSTVGFDPSVHTAEEVSKLAHDLSSVGSKLVPVANLVDTIRTDRPARPARPIHVHPIHLAGKSHFQKLDELRGEIRKRGCNATLISALDEITWLLNLRGSDIHCSPVFFAYCLVTQDKTTLYLHNELGRSGSDDIRLHLGDVEICEFSRLLEDLARTPGRFILDGSTNFSIVQTLGEDRIRYEPSLIALSKAVKNEAELVGVRACHRRDAAAVCQHFAWLEHSLQNGNRICEAEAADHLNNMRRQHPEYIGQSFDTIAATGANGAIVHYQPPSVGSALIDPRQIYLCDSGAHYLDGTTDITRTYLFMGQPTEFQQRAYTRVLQAHITLDQTVFPEGITGYQLDAIARRPMWQDGLDYRHGTGHGVGAYLNVHEGPHGIGRRPAYDKVALQKGMLVTNGNILEPGYYEDGQFGIRIENVLTVRKHSIQGYLGFEHLTFVPLGSRLMHHQLLSQAERRWINNYHEECRNILEPQLKTDKLTMAWVEKETARIDE